MGSSECQGQDRPKSKARLNRFEEMSSYEYQKRNETNEIFIPVADRLGDKVIEFKNVLRVSAIVS